MGVHSPKAPDTCASCGAIVRAQNTQCNRCHAYIGAPRWENALLRALIPDSLAPRVGTVLIAVSCIAAWAIIGVATQLDSLMSMSSYSLLRFGATHGIFLYIGEFWRLFTSIFLHHDVLHLAMNMYALLFVGTLLEERTDRYVVASVFVFGGALSMLVSWAWYMLSPTGSILYTSAGASGGVTALIGACWYIARTRTYEKELERGMLRWSLIMLLFGLFVSGVNNAAHIGGWVVGVLFMMSWRSAPRLYAWRRLLALGALVAVMTSATLQIVASWGMPTALAADASPSGMIFFGRTPGVAWERSSNYASVTACDDAINRPKADQRPREIVVTCRYAATANPHNPTIWSALAYAYEHANQPIAAQRTEAAGRFMIQTWLRDSSEH